MGTNIVDISKFKKGPSAALAARAAEAGSLADGIGSSYGIIYYRGKVWSLRYRGTTHIFRRGDDGTAAPAIKFVILRDPGRKSKQYYPEWKDGEERKPPVCSSLDGITPQPDSIQLQAESCALCPRNEGKRDATGRWKKECQDHKRVAVMLHPDSTEPLFKGQALLEPVLLHVPAGSLANFGAMGKEMDDMGYPYSTYVTQASFDEAESYPKMVFKAIDPLEGAEAEFILKSLDNSDVKRITGEEGPRTAMRQLGVQQAPVRIEPPKPSGFATAKPVQIEAPKAEPVTIDVKANVEEAVQSGFAQAARQVEAPRAPANTSAAVEDELPPADAGLDATIAQMVNAVKGNG